MTSIKNNSSLEEAILLNRIKNSANQEEKNQLEEELKDLKEKNVELENQIKE